MSSCYLGLALLLLAETAVGIGDKCGGFLNNTSGNISSPSYPKPYEPGLNCSWTISNSSYFWIKELVLDEGDYLAVYNGSRDGSLIYNFTGIQGFGVAYSSAANTTVEFISRNVTKSSSQRRFLLQYDASACLIPVNEATGLLPSPHFVQAAGTINCTYVLNLNSSQQVIDLTFVQFRLKKGQLSVEVGNNIIATYTNEDEKPADLLVPSDSLTINMLISTSLKQNFTVAYTKWDKDCSAMILVNKTLTVSSPNHHGNYDNNLHCLLMLSSPTNSTLRLEFSELSLADANDQVTIKDGGSILDDNIAVMTAGSQYAGIYYLTSSNLTQIIFITDQLLTSRGYELIITPQAYGQRFVDSGQFTLGIPANMTGENEPQTVLPTSDIISYQFEAQESNQVHIQFGQDAVLFPNTTIECYDGFSSDDGLVGYFTSTDAFHPVFSSGSRLLVLVKGFLRNGTMTHQYLSGSFKAVSNDGTLRNSLGDTGSLTLTLMEDEYPWRATWLIHNYEALELISLKLHMVTLGDNSSVAVYQGLSDQSWLVTKINMSRTDVPEIYISKLVAGCRVVYETSHQQAEGHMDQLDVVAETADMTAMRMRTAGMAAGMSNIKEQTVLRATYSRLPDCSANVTSQSGSILTPGYPGLYPYNADCFWNISVPDDKLLHLSFGLLDLAPFHILQISQVSYHDYNITVGNETKHVQNVSTTNLGIYGGQGQINDIIGSGNHSHIEVVFSSGFEKNPAGGVYVAQGVNISYEVIDCGGNLTQSNASLSVPSGIAGDPNTTLTCVWIISLPNTTHANGSVNIVSFTYHFRQTSTSSLVIRDGATSLSESIPLNMSGSSMLSRMDKLWIKYTFQPSQDSNANFQLTYTTYVCPKSQQCNNSICMHEDWRCNGRDDCGDGSDEDGCTYSKPGREGYAGWALGVAIFATFILTIALTIVFLMIYRRYRYSNYSELRDIMAPVPT